MYTYLLVLRIVHIACGVFWAGTAFFLAYYVFPAVIKSGPDGPKIMTAITGIRKFPTVLTLAALLTVLSGILLMWQLSGGFAGIWFTSTYGMILTLGGITATIAFFQALFINKPGVQKLQEIGSSVTARGGAPTDEERNVMMKLRARIFFSTQLIAFWLLVTVVTMGIARYA
jgi:uncharacterized membrane protein